MKRVTLLVALVMLMLVSLAVVSVGAAAAPCDTTLTVGDNIQTAIDSATPGDVICLAAGTYSLAATINIDKSITLQGPQAGVDPRPSTGSSRVLGDATTEAVIDGANNLGVVIFITASDVTLDGLDVKSGTGDMIDWDSGTPTSGTVIRYNIVHDAGDEGMQLRACTDCTVEYNFVTDIDQDGINMSYDSDRGLIQFNDVTENSSDNAAIYVYGSEDMTIKCNLVSNVYGNDGIKLGAKGGGNAALSGGSILYNTVHDTVQDGITVYTSDTTVEGNEVYNSSSENGAIYVSWAVENIDIVKNYVHDNALDTLKVDPGAVTIGSLVNATTVTVNNNNFVNNTVNGLTNDAVALLDGKSNWWGAADGPSGVGSGSGDAVSLNVDFDAWLAAPVEIANMCNPDDEGPPTTNVLADPNPAPIDSEVAVTALVDDTTTGGSDIASAVFTVYEYSYDTGQGADVANGTMSAKDGAFDSPTEEVTASFTAASVPEVYQLCVYGSDSAGNDGPESCILFVVYDPSAGFVTGGGWIDSPSGAYMPSLYGEGQTFFMETFDTDPPLSDTAGAGVWYTDRYPPSVFESAPFDGDNRLHVAIAGSDYLPHGSTFYNYQGRKYDLWNGVNTYLTADLYIGADWETNDRHASIWATTFDANNQISGYPIAGFTALDSSTGLPKGFRIYTQDLNQDAACDTTCAPGWYDIGLPTGFEYGQWYTLRAELSADAYRYYINGELVFEDVVTFNSIVFGNMMLQAYNYGADYDVYWDNVGAGPIYEDLVGKASFGFVSKYNRGKTVPTGNTTFVFQNAGLNFKSDSYDWLVVTGSDYAKFKGEGTINNQLAPNGQPYKFMLWAGDGTGSGGEDTFRIKIWYEDGGDVIVYDNGMDQAIDSGNIVVHKGKK